MDEAEEAIDFLNNQNNLERMDQREKINHHARGFIIHRDGLQPEHGF